MSSRKCTHWHVWNFRLFANSSIWAMLLDPFHKRQPSHTLPICHILLLWNIATNDYIDIYLINLPYSQSAVWLWKVFDVMVSVFPVQRLKNFLVNAQMHKINQINMSWSHIWEPPGYRWQYWCQRAQLFAGHCPTSDMIGVNQSLHVIITWWATQDPPGEITILII